jgi:anti-sigma regulatory factor (Ser/Thr protein kinase)
VSDVCRTALTNPFTHEALLYRDIDSYLVGSLSFIRAGIAAGGAVLVAAPRANLHRLADEIGAERAGMCLVDMYDEGCNPGRVIPWLLQAFVDAHPWRAARVVCEQMWPGRSPDEYPGCVQQEALLNAVFSGRDARILCPYDVANLEPHVIADAATTHPTVIDGSERRVSEHYGDPHAVVEAFNLPLPDLGPPEVSMRFDASAVNSVRRLVALHAAYAGMAPERATELHTAVNEVATNAVVHGGGAGAFAIYRGRDRLICEIRDAGRISDPLVGRIPAQRGAKLGRGLLLVHRVCDLVQTHVNDTGTTTRLHMRLGRAAT